MVLNATLEPAASPRCHALSGSSSLARIDSDGTDTPTVRPRSPSLPVRGRVTARDWGAAWWERGLLIVLLAVFVRSAFWREPFPAMGAASQPPDEAAVAPPTGIYTEDEIAFFLEVGLGAEYGDAEAVLHKWTIDIVLELVGSFTDADLRAVEALAEEVSALQSSIVIRLATESDVPNFKIVFAPQHEFSVHEPNYVPPNPAYFWVWWNYRNEIRSARILLDEALDADLRAAFLR